MLLLSNCFCCFTISCSVVSVSLTKTTKKGLQAKQKLVEEIRKCVGKFHHIFVFSVENMRNSKLKDLREDWKESRYI